MRQLNLFFCAVQFLTRIPVPPLKDFELGWITRSAKYFPLVGQIVGALSGAVLLAADEFWIWPLPALLAIAAGVLITGAFHEDGLADTADGLGGGRDIGQRLVIMKDSRIGTYGAVTLMLVLAIKAAALSPMTADTAALILIAANGLGRTAAVIAMTTMRYAGDPEASKMKPVPDGVTGPECLLAIAFGLWPLLLLPAPVIAPALIAGGLLALLMAFTARRLIKGYTGDVLGAIEQMFEVGFLLAAAAVI